MVFSHSFFGYKLWGRHDENLEDFTIFLCSTSVVHRLLWYYWRKWPAESVWKQDDSDTGRGTINALVRKRFGKTFFTFGQYCLPTFCGNRWIWMNLDIENATNIFSEWVMGRHFLPGSSHPCSWLSQLCRGGNNSRGIENSLHNVPLILSKIHGQQGDQLGHTNKPAQSKGCGCWWKGDSKLQWSCQSMCRSPTHW